MPNASFHVLILAVEEVLGKNGFNAVLKAAKLDFLVGKRPPNNLDRDVPYSLYAAVEQAIEDFYGPRGSRAILQRVGRATFRYTLHERPAILGLAGLALKALPVGTRQKVILEQIVKASTEETNLPAELEEHDDHFIYIRKAGPCQFRKRDTSGGPCDFVVMGVLSEALKWATGKNFRVSQETCMNVGDPADRIRVEKEPMED
ncbi:MAG: hypothetical protein ACE5H9_11900 [Anaerolineae bacterium]